MTPADVIKLVRDEGIEIIDLKFTDLPGTLQHVGIRQLAEVRVG